MDWQNPSVPSSSALDISPPSVSDDQQYRHVLDMIHGGHVAVALSLAQAALCFRPGSPLLEATLSYVLFKVSQQSCHPKAAVPHIYNAIRFSERLITTFPNSISSAVVHSFLLFQVAEMGLIPHYSVVQECLRGMLRCGIHCPPSRRLSLTKMLADILKRSAVKIAVLGSGNGRDNWEILLQDSYLKDLKMKFQILQWKKKSLVEARPLNFGSPGEQTTFKKPKALKPDMFAKSAVTAFWKENMSAENKKGLLRIGVRELEAYLDTNELGMAKDKLMEAICYAKAAMKWRFWSCCHCGQRNLDGVSMAEHVKIGHLDALPKSLQSVMPEIASLSTFLILGPGLWRPIDSGADFWEISSSAAYEEQEVSPDPSSPHSLSSQRDGVLQSVLEKLDLLDGNRCLAMSHHNMLTEKLTLKRTSTDHQRHNTRRLLCLLELPELRRVLECLEDLATACSLTSLGETFPADEVRGDQGLCGGIRESIVCSSDFSLLIFDARLSQGRIDVLDDGTAVVTWPASLTNSDVGGDAFLNWLCTGGPPLMEQPEAWERLRAYGRRRGMELYEIMKDEFRHVQWLCMGKMEYLKYKKPLADVHRIFTEEARRREVVAEHKPLNYLVLLLRRGMKLQTEGRSSLELQVIWSVIKEAQEDDAILNEILRQREHLKRQLYRHDAIILATCAAMHQTSLKIAQLSVFDYRFILVPILKSFMQARLEDLFNNDLRQGTQKSGVPITGN